MKKNAIDLVDDAIRARLETFVKGFVEFADTPLSLYGPNHSAARP